MSDQNVSTARAANSQLREDLDRLVQSGRFGDSLSELNARLSCSGMNFEGRRYSYNPAPLFVDAVDAKSICQKAESLSKILEKVGKLFSSDKDVRTFFSNYESLLEITMVDVDYQPMAHLNRFDTVWLGGDRFKILEPNCCCPAGVISNAITREAWLSVPAFKNLIKNYDVVSYPIDDRSTFARSLIAMATKYARSELVALANYNGCFTFELDLIAAELEKQGCKTIVADLADFDCQNGKLLKGGAEVGLVYNKLDQLMLRDGFEHLDYFKAYKDGSFVCLNSFRSQIILEDKAVLAFLCDPSNSHHFNRGELALIKAHVPWTFRVVDSVTTHPTSGSIRLVDYVLASKNNLVLKPSNQTRGAGVTIGRYVEEDQWEQALSAAFDGEWIVQEFCELPVSPVVAGTSQGDFLVTDWQYSLDVFVLGGQAIGLTSRSNDGGIINVGSGGMRRPVIVVNNSVLFSRL